MFARPNRRLPAKKNYAWMQAARKAAQSASSWLQESRSAMMKVRKHLSAMNETWLERVATLEPGHIEGTAEPGAELQSYKLDIITPPALQINTGYELSGSSNAVIQTGTHSFYITQGGQTSYLSVSISASDTNYHSLIKVRDAINQASLAVQATAIKNNGNDTVWLVVKSTETGHHRSFAAADLSGHAINAAGIGRMVQAAADCAYRINDGPIKSSASREIALDHDRVKFRIDSATPQTATVRVSFNARQAARHMQAVLAEINRLAELHRTLSLSLKPALMRTLEETMNKPELKQLGVIRNVSGVWELDEARWTQTARDRPAQAKLALSGPGGWGASLLRILETFDQQPPLDIIDADAQSIHAFTIYQPTARPGFQLPPSGWLLNHTF
ncbi:hypothetical protein EBB07_01845 [Paenibacillaceae bacterium]|nr:hypothetical protein EBB07_01845 [Paenibacillaceae bacterium]